MRARCPRPKPGVCFSSSLLSIPPEAGSQECPTWVLLPWTPATPHGWIRYRWRRMEHRSLNDDSSVCCTYSMGNGKTPNKY